MDNTTATEVKTEKTSAATAKTTAKSPKVIVKSIDPVYTAAQLADGYKVFNTTRAIVECALKLSGKDSFTMDEAKKLITEFRTRS